MDNDFVKKTVHGNMIIQANTIDTQIPSTSGLDTKTYYDSGKQGFGFWRCW